MSGARAAMRQRCTIQRDQADPDTYGAETASDWQDHLTALPCISYVRASRAAIDANRTAAVEDMRVLLPLGTDVTSADQIGDITDRLGVTLIAGPLAIDAIARRRDHLELLVREVS